MYAILIRPVLALPQLSTVAARPATASSMSGRLQAIWTRGTDGRCSLRWQRGFESLPPA